MEYAPKIVYTLWKFTHSNNITGAKKEIYFIFDSIFCHFNKSVDKNLFLFYLAPNSLLCMSYLYITERFFVFWALFDPPLLFVTFF